MTVKLPAVKALSTPAARIRTPTIWTNVQQAVEEVVDVVGRGEPGEVDPGPPDAEEDQEVADDGGVEVAGTQGGVELAGRLRDGDDEAEVEEKLERGGGPMLLVDVPRAHRQHAEPTPGHGCPVGSAAREVGGGRMGGSIAADPRVFGDRCPERTKPPRAEALRGFREKSRRRPTLPGGLPPSTIGAGGLNCRVRNGNGCFPAAMATGNLALGGARAIPCRRTGPRLRLRFRSP